MGGSEFGVRYLGPYDKGILLCGNLHQGSSMFVNLQFITWPVPTFKPQQNTSRV